MGLEIKKEGLFIDGEKFYLASGDIHYFRIMPQSWKRRLMMMKDFGLTAIQTYVPWNQHEPTHQNFDFEGRLNLKAFLKLCQEVGLYVMLRPAPYITSETDLGSIPAWVIRDTDANIRCSETYYLSCIKSYYERVCKEFVPMLATNGGPVIAVALENEYGSFGGDKKYLNFLKNTLEDNGVDVPFYTTDGAGQWIFKNGNLAGTWAAVNCGLDVEESINQLRKYQPDKPSYIGEFWSGGHTVWGASKHLKRDIQPICESYEKALLMGAYVNFYMFGGGTNFGFTNGMHYGLPTHAKKGDPFRYYTYQTSYDTDAPIDECGNATPKYYALRRVLDKFLGKPIREDKIPDAPMQTIENVKLSCVDNLFDCKDKIAQKIVKSVCPMSMESMGQNFGYTLYSTDVMGCDTEDEVDLYIDGLHDMALVYADGVYVGSYLRDESSDENGKNKIRIKLKKEGFRLDILVENLGRIDAAKYWRERKGIAGVRLSCVHIHDWKMTLLPMNYPLNIGNCPCEKKEGPAFYRGTFDAKPGIDTFLTTENLTKGIVFINGFNIGKYWNLGPQQCLYVPGELLKEKDNEILIFEMFDAGDFAKFTDKRTYGVDKENVFYERINRMQ